MEASVVMGHGLALGRDGESDRHIVPGNDSGNEAPSISVNLLGNRERRGDDGCPRVYGANVFRIIKLWTVNGDPVGESRIRSWGPHS